MTTPIARDCAYRLLLKTLSQTHDTENMQALLSALLTEKEQIELSNRVKIFALLQQELPQREISSRLGVGVATVSRGAKAYQQHHVAELIPNLSDIVESI